MFSNIKPRIFVLGGYGRLGQRLYDFFHDTCYDISILSVDALDAFISNELPFCDCQTIVFINCVGDYRTPNSYYASNFYLPVHVFSLLNTVSSRHNLFFYHISSVGSLSPYSTFNLNPLRFNHLSRSQIFNLYELSKRCSDTALRFMHSLSPSVSVTVIQPSVLIFDPLHKSKLFFFVKLLFLLFPFSLKNLVSPPITYVCSIPEYIFNDIARISSFSTERGFFYEVALFSRFSIASFPFLQLLDSFKPRLSAKFCVRLQSFIKRLPSNNPVSRFLVFVFVL